MFAPESGCTAYVFRIQGEKIENSGTFDKAHGMLIA